MIASSALGCLLIGAGAVLGWFAVIQFGWFPYLARKYIKYPVPGVIVIATLILTLFMRAGKLDVPKDPSQVAVKRPFVTPSAQDSPRSTVVAVGEANNVMVNTIGTQKTATLLNRTDEEILRLRNEYNFGFVLIAFSGEVETTKVKSYADRIRADWDNSRAYMDQRGRVVIEVPRFRAKGYPSGSIDLNPLRVSVPATPGMSLPGLVLGDMRIQCECLETQPIGICAVIGFKKIDAP